MRQQIKDRDRGSAQDRGYTSRWHDASRLHLVRYPLCGMRAPNAYAGGWRGACYAQQRLTAATVTDHITAHKGDEALFWDPRNWQSLCATCNGIKNVRYEGGFGRAHP